MTIFLLNYLIMEVKMMKSIAAKKQTCCKRLVFLAASNAVRSRQRTALPPKHLRYRGIALAWTALVIFVLLLLVGLSIDTANLCLVNHQLQNGADAGALAGAQFVKYNQEQARNMAVSIAAANYAEKLTIFVDDNTSNDPNGELVLGRWIRQLRLFIPTTISPTAVKVVSRRLGQREDAPQVSYIFGPLVDVFSGGLQREAIAWSQHTTGAGIITLAEYPEIYRSEGWNHDTGLIIHGNPTVDLRGFDYRDGSPMTGDIQVNSQSDPEHGPWSAFRLTGSSAEIFANDFNVSGTTNPDADNTDRWAEIYGDPYNPCSVNPYCEPIEDPLEYMADPDISSMTVHFPNVIDDAYVASHGTTEVDPTTGQLTNVLTLTPGHYPGGINIVGAVDANSPKTKVILAGGTDESVYAFGGGSTGDSGLVMTGGTLVGEGVMIYITSDTESSSSNGKIEIHGDTSVQIISRGDADGSGRVNGEIGTAIWQSRHNPTYGKIIGGGDMNIVGTIYCGYNPMEIGGSSNQMGNQLIAGTLNMHGNTPIRIAYDGRNGYVTSQSILVK